MKNRFNFVYNSVHRFSHTQKIFFYLSCPANQYLFHIFLFSKKTRLELWVCILGSISTNGFEENLKIFFIKIMFSHFPILRYHPTLCNGSELSFGKFGRASSFGSEGEILVHIWGKFGAGAKSQNSNATRNSWLWGDNWKVGNRFDTFLTFRCYRQIYN